MQLSTVLSGWLVAAVLASAGLGQEAPRRDADLVALANAEHAATLAQPGNIYHNRALATYADEVLRRLVAYSAQPDDDWSVTIINTAVPFAETIAGGQIYLSRGLFTVLADEDELAAVLSHEISHVVANDFGPRLAQRPVPVEHNVLVRWLMPLAILNAENVAEADYFTLLRSQEAAADRQAVILLQAAGYDPMAISDALAAMRDWLAYTANRDDIPYDPAALHWRDEYPPYTQRVADTAAQAAAYGPPPARRRAPYLAMIDRLHFGDPRVQFFRFENHVVFMPLAHFATYPDEYELRVEDHFAEVIAPDGRRVFLDTVADPGGNLRDYITGPWFQSIRATYPDARFRFQRARNFTVDELDLALSGGELLATMDDGSEFMFVLALLRGEDTLVRSFAKYPLRPGTIRRVAGGQVTVNVINVELNPAVEEDKNWMDGPRLLVHALAPGDTVDALMMGIDEPADRAALFAVLNGGISSDAELAELPPGTIVYAINYDPPKR